MNKEQRKVHWLIIENKKSLIQISILEKMNKRFFL